MLKWLVSATPVSKTSVFAFTGTFPTLPRKEVSRALALVVSLLPAAASVSLCSLTEEVLAVMGTA